MNLDQTLKKFKKGNNIAFQKLYDSYSGALMGVCLRFARNRSDAEDILQDGFIKIYKYRKTFDLDAGFGFYGWAKKIIINNAINFCKKNYKYSFTDSELDLVDPDSEYHYESKYKSEIALCEAKLLSMVQELPDGYRTIFNLAVFENLTHQEIADYLGITVNTSKSQLSRARKILQHRIELITKKKETAKVS